VASDPDETAEQALQIAEAALGDLARFLGDAVAVEDLRQAWNRLLPQEGGGEVGAVEQLSGAGRVASELLLAVLAASGEGSSETASPSDRTAAVEPSTDAGLFHAERQQALVVAAQDALVAAQAEVARLEPELGRAKVRFGNAIRRLYQAGVSVSSIAQAMGMSEEAVERVVGAPTADDYQPVLACNFCNGSFRRLIAGPGVYICAECVEVAQAVGAETRQDSRAVLQETDDESGCSFCRKRPRQVRFVVAAESTRICDECLDLCAEILAEELGV
jgi:hypothetical protein